MRLRLILAFVCIVLVTLARVIIISRYSTASQVRNFMWNLSEARHFVRLTRIAPRSDVMVLLACFSLTVVFDMVIAVSVGVVLAAFLFMRRMAVLTRVTLDTGLAHAIHMPEGVRLYEIAGPMFFGAANVAMEGLETVVPHVLENLCFENQKDVEALFASEGISIQIHGKYGTSPLCHDRKKLQQILRNLISNGLKYRRERIRIVVTGDEDLVISVEDDVCGIAPERQESLFKRFARLEDANRSDLQGTGLGLWGVKLLVETMGGEIRVESCQEAGARFTIRIPPLQAPR